MYSGEIYIPLPWDSCFHLSGEKLLISENKVIAVLKLIRFVVSYSFLHAFIPQHTRVEELQELVVGRLLGSLDGCLVLFYAFW